MSLKVACPQSSTYSLRSVAPATQRDAISHRLMSSSAIGADIRSLDLRVDSCDWTLLKSHILDQCAMSDHEHAHRNTQASAVSPLELRVRALETVLTQKGYVDPKALDVLIDAYQTKIGPRNGAQVVARAWCDQNFAAGCSRMQPRRSPRWDSRDGRASTWWRSRTPQDVHNMVVCTLCSCYPWAVLGLAADLVQKRALSRTRREGSAWRAARIRRRIAAIGAHSHLGFDRRGALPRAAAAAGGNRTFERTRSCGPW